MSDRKSQRAPSLAAEIDDLEARLERSKQKLRSMAPSGEPAVRLKEPVSQTQVRQLAIDDIGTKLGEVREARRTRQALPKPDPKK